MIKSRERERYSLCVCGGGGASHCREQNHGDVRERDAQVRLRDKRERKIRKEDK